MNESNGAAPEGGNVADTKALINECRTAMNEIAEQRKELNEQAADIRERLRDAGIQVKAFEFSRRLYNMEIEARASYLDDLHVSMEAMGIGEHGDFFQATGGEAVAQPAPH